MKKNKIEIIIVLLLIIISQFASGKNSKNRNDYLANILFGDNPTYQLILKNDTLVNNLRYEFDIYIVRTGTVPLELVQVSPVMTFNPAISTGSLSFTINSGSSELGVRQQPLNKNISIVGNELHVGSEPVIYPPEVTFVDSVSGNRVGRFRITSSTPFKDHPANVAWKNSGPILITDVSAYVSELTTDITDSTGHLNVLTNTTLSPLAITSLSPLPNVSAGVAYVDTLRVTGGTLPYEWTIIANSLPSGLSLSTSGVITGTATNSGTSTFTVQVTDGLSTSVTKIFSITVNPGPAARLIIQTQPSSTATAGIPFSTQPAIRIEDTFGNLVVSDNSTVVTASRNTGNGILQGVSSATAVSGVATFTNLSYTLAETFTTQFTSGSLTAATSNSISVNAGTATKVFVETNPTGSGTVVPSQNLASGNSITVYAVSRDTFDNFVANVAATWSLIDITGGIVAGDFVPNVGDTSATLTGSIIGTAKIKATYGTLDSIQSGTITVIPGVGTELTYTQQPTAGIAGAVITPPVKVQIKDLVGNNVRNPGDTINIALHSGSGILSGTIQQISDTAGTTTFNNLRIDQSGLKTLRAYHTIYSSALSDTFTLGTYTITSTAGANGSISPLGTVNVNSDGNQAFTITPNTGYHVDSLIVDGLKVDSTTSYTFNNVTANHTLRAVFAINSYTITSTAGSNGSISPLGIVNVNYGDSQTFTITPNIGYHIDSLQVDGLKVDSTTSYTFNNVSTNHTISAYFSFTCSPLTINPATIPDGVSGVEYSQTLTALAGTSPYTFVVSSGSLPNGLSLANDGIISGSPIVHGTSSFTVTATDANGCTGNQGYSLTINCAAITLSPTTVPSGDSGVAYNQTITASGGIEPHGFTLTNGTLPSGISLSGAGVLSGTTNVIGSYNITITATDAIGCTGTKDYVLSIYDNRPVASFTANPHPAACNQSVSFDASGSSHGRPDRTIVSYDWNFGDGNTGAGSVTTHAFSAYGTYTVTLTVTDNNVPPKTATTSTVVTVSQGNQPPVANAGGPYTVDLGSSLILDGTASSDPNVGCGDAIVSYAWDINNDGTYGDLTGTRPTLTEATISSLGRGMHTIGLRVTDTFGATNAGSSTITILQWQTITSTTGPNGNITPLGVLSVNYDSTQAFTITPNIGYHVDSVIVDGIKVDSTTSYTFNNVTTDHTIRVVFSIDVYTITSTTGANGGISPLGAVSVNYGGSQTFTISPDRGYHVDSMIVDGVKVDSITSYTFNNVSTNHTIRAAFAINAYTITATTGANGNIIPSGVVGVSYGGSQTFTLTPNTGYHVDSVFVDGVYVGAVTSYPFTNVTTNHTISAKFAINVYTITSTAGANGSISPSGAVSVNYSGSQAFAITPHTGYHIDSVIVNGVKVDSSTSYAFNNVTTNHTIRAVFAADIPVVNVKILLQAPFSSGAMNSALHNILPLSQPYSTAPWNYSGTEHVAVIPDSAVDWVLVELRTSTSPSTKVATRAAFLKQNGQIVDTGGLASLKFSSIAVGNYYVIIRHRNHIPVMSASAVSLTATSNLYDFTTGTTKYFGNDAKLLSFGKYGMYAGDYSGDGFVDSDDFIGPDNEMFQSGYRRADLDMNGFIDSDDFIHPDNNVFKGTNVPK